MRDLAAAEKSELSERGEKLSVGLQCLLCTNILCHDCLVDWAVTTVSALHVPDAHSQADILKLKCSTKNCEEILTVDKLMQILDPARFEKVSLALNRRVLQSSEDFIACPNPGCNSFGFYNNQDGEEYHEVACAEPFECQACEFRW